MITTGLLCADIPLFSSLPSYRLQVSRDTFVHNVVNRYRIVPEPTGIPRERGSCRGSAAGPPLCTHNVLSKLYQA